MGFRIEITPAAKKALKKASRELKIKIVEEAKKIPRHLYQHEKLSDPLSDCYSWHFTFKGTHYRIAYKVFSQEELIVVILVGPRENFYEKIKRLLK